MLIYRAATVGRKSGEEKKKMKFIWSALLWAEQMLNRDDQSQRWEEGRSGHVIGVCVCVRCENAAAGRTAEKVMTVKFPKTQKKKQKLIKKKPTCL